MDLYAQHILEHFRHPRGKKRLTSADITHEENNPACGDRLTVDLAIENGSVRIGWGGEGCSISQAAMSMLAEDFAGKPMVQLQALTPKDLLDRLGVPIGPRRMKCAMLCLHTVRNALNLLRKEPPQSWAETLESSGNGG